MNESIFRRKLFIVTISLILLAVFSPYMIAYQSVNRIIITASIWSIIVIENNWMLIIPPLIGLLIAFVILIRCRGSLKVCLHLAHLNRPSFSDQILLFEHFGQVRFIPGLTNITGTIFQTLPKFILFYLRDLRVLRGEIAIGGIQLEIFR